MNNNEEKVNNFLEELFSDRAPDYLQFKKNRELIEIAEISLLLRKGISENKNFKDELAQRLNKEYNKQYGKETNVWTKKKVMFNLLSLGLSFSLLLIVLNPFVFKSYKRRSQFVSNFVKQNSSRKADIVKIKTYRFSDKKTIRLLYNERNNVILYWPFGQLAIFQ